MTSDAIEAELKERNPLISALGLKMLRRLQEHPDAPRWNHAAGDRLVAKDLEALAGFKQELFEKRSSLSPTRADENSPLPEHVAVWVKSMRETVPLFRERVPRTEDLASIWTRIPTTGREDIAVRPHHFVPDDADLANLIVYRTAGTTGHALLVPHSARAAAMYRPLKELALSFYGITSAFDTDAVACILVCAQARTVTFATVFSDWQQAGFAKVNLTPSDWPKPTSPASYFDSMQPVLLTGDPISFAEMLRLQIKCAPLAMISTAVAMSTGLKQRLESFYKCPVIDWYSLTETGPIGYACKHGFGYHILPTDLFVEAIDSSGRQVTAGSIGEITVTGGRNPYLPLLRYRTGDWGRVVNEPCTCGDSSPRLMDLEGRAPVIFRNAAGGPINPVDISGVLRNFALVQHEFAQATDLACSLTIRPVAGGGADLQEIEGALEKLFGPGVAFKIEIDEYLGQRSESGKVIPYRSDFLLED